MTPLRELLAVFGIKVDDSEIKGADKTIKGMIGTLRNFAGSVAGSFVARGIARMIDSTTSAADRIGELSIQIGVNAQALQGWAFAAQMAGVEQESLAQAFAILSRNANAAAGGSKDMRAAFARLGVQTTDGEGRLRNASDIMMEVAGGLGSMTNESERTALSLQILGRGGRQLLPLFKDGAAGVAAARKEFEELGGGFSDDDIKQADEFQDSLVKMNVTLTKLKVLFVREILPILQRFLGWLLKNGRELIKSGRAASLMKTALQGLAIAAALIARSFVRLLLPFGPVIIKFAALFLLVDEIITLFRGGETVIGKFIDKLFGIGTAAKGVEFLKDSIKGFAKLAMDAANAIAFLRGEDPIFVGEGGVAAERRRAQEFTGKGLRADRPRQEQIDEMEIADELTRQRAINRSKAVLTGTFGRDPSVPESLARPENVTINVTVPNADPKEVAAEIERMADGRRRKELTATKAALKPQAATP
jgi:hypothetical protein